MGFNNPTNKGRVDRMVETLDLIEASERSNRAKWQDTAELLAPLLGRLTRYHGHAPIVHAAEPMVAPPAGSHRAFNNIREMAEQADLSDLTVAMAVYLSRLDARFAEDS